MILPRFNFSNELLQLPKYYQDEIIGKTVRCADGKYRRVERKSNGKVDCVHSMRYPWYCIINEEDPGSNAGYFVSNLVITAVILKEPEPSLDAEEAFKRAVMVKFQVGEDGKRTGPVPTEKPRIWVPVSNSKTTQ